MLYNFTQCKLSLLFVTISSLLLKRWTNIPIRFVIRHPVYLNKWILDSCTKIVCFGVYYHQNRSKGVRVVRRHQAPSQIGSSYVHLVITTNSRMITRKKDFRTRRQIVLLQCWLSSLEVCSINFERLCMYEKIRKRQSKILSIFNKMYYNALLKYFHYWIFLILIEFSLE